MIQVNILGNMTLLISLFVALMSVVPSQCRADDVYTFVVKKQEEKAKSRWNLTDWLTARDTMRMQDLWLALHSPSPYEFFLDFNYQFNQVVGGGGFNTWEVDLGAFVTIFGLEGHYSNGLEQQMTGLFDLRVFGFHDQSTHMTFQLGGRNTIESGGNTYLNFLLGGRLAIYIAKPFGLEGVFHHYFPSTIGSSGVSYSGDKVQGGAFLEFKFLRLYVEYFYNAETLFTRNGVVVGSKVYF